MRIKQVSSWRPTSGVRRAVASVLGTGLLCCVGCAHAPVLVVPEPAPTFSLEEVEDYAQLEASGDYPGVVSMVRKFMDVACDNDALAGRDTSHCDQQAICLESDCGGGECLLDAHCPPGCLCEEGYCGDHEPS